MGVLRGFRVIPSDRRDWASWFARQEIESGLGNPERDGMHLASLADGTRYWESPPGLTETEDGVQRWTIKEIEDDYAPAEPDDDNILLLFTKATAMNCTMEPDRFQLGAQLTYMQYGAGTVTFVEGTGVSIHTPSGLDINEQYGTISMIQVKANEWMFAGRMAAP